MTEGIQEGDNVRMTLSGESFEVEVVSLPKNPLATMVKVRLQDGRDMMVPRSDLRAISSEDDGISFDGRSDLRIGRSEDAAFDRGTRERGDK